MLSTYRAPAAPTGARSTPSENSAPWSFICGSTHSLPVGLDRKLRRSRQREDLLREAEPQAGRQDERHRRPIPAVATGTRPRVQRRRLPRLRPARCPSLRRGVARLGAERSRGGVGGSGSTSVSKRKGWGPGSDLPVESRAAGRQGRGCPEDPGQIRRPDARGRSPDRHGPGPTGAGRRPGSGWPGRRSRPGQPGWTCPRTRRSGRRARERTPAACVVA